jgi:hypothetical protein
VPIVLATAGQDRLAIRAKGYSRHLMTVEERFGGKCTIVSAPYTGLAPHIIIAIRTAHTSRQDARAIRTKGCSVDIVLILENHVTGFARGCLPELNFTAGIVMCDRQDVLAIWTERDNSHLLFVRQRRT